MGIAGCRRRGHFHFAAVFQQVVPPHDDRIARFQTLADHLHELVPLDAALHCVGDRVMVLHEGRVAGEFTRTGATPEKVMAAATGESNLQMVS